MTKFEFGGRAELRHLNARKQGPDDEKILALDLKLRVRAPATILDVFEPALRPALFLDNGAVRNPMVAPIGFDYTLIDYRLDALGSSFYGCEIKRFAAEPQDGNEVDLSFVLSLKPGADEVARFAEYLGDEFDIALEPETPDLDFEGADEAEEAA